MRTKILIPKTINPTKRVQIANAIITHIQDRTFAGLDKSNSPFPKYSKEYAAIKGSTDVDLVLSGEMMDSIKLLSSKSGELLIGFDKSDKALNGKAEGNIKGSYGGVPDKDKARDFLGIDQDELDAIVSAFEEDVQISQEEINQLTKEILDDILDNL